MISAGRSTIAWAPAVVLALALACRAERAQPPQSPPSADDSATRAGPSPEPPAPDPGGDGTRASSAGLGVELLPAQAPEVSPCEASCGAVHGCLVLDGRPAREAASIELGCLENCLAQAKAAEPFGCPRPEPLGPEACASFQTCVAESWVPVEQLRPVNPFDNPSFGAGCERVCMIYATCRGLDQVVSTGDSEAIDKCTKRCQMLLEPAQIKRAEDCTRMDNCTDIKDCIETIDRVR